MTIKLTDAQHLMLNAAAQRDDRILAMPPNLKGGAAQKVAGILASAAIATAFGLSKPLSFVSPTHAETPVDRSP
jgi:hypothetical protein